MHLEEVVQAQQRAFVGHTCAHTLQKVTRFTFFLLGKHVRKSSVDGGDHAHESESASSLHTGTHTLPSVTATALQVWHGATQKPVGGGPPTVLHSVRSVDGRVLLHEPLEYRLPRFELIDTASIDVVLVSNCHTLLALPYLAERTAFSGVVYATEPTLRFGAHLMTSMIAHDTEAPRRPSRHGWKVTRPPCTAARTHLAPMHTSPHFGRIERLDAP